MEINQGLRLSLPWTGKCLKYPVLLTFLHSKECSCFDLHTANVKPKLRFCEKNQRKLFHLNSIISGLLLNLEWWHCVCFLLTINGLSLVACSWLLLSACNRLKLLPQCDYRSRLDSKIIALEICGFHKIDSVTLLEIYELTTSHLIDGFISQMI